MILRGGRNIAAEFRYYRGESRVYGGGINSLRGLSWFPLPEPKAAPCGHLPPRAHRRPGWRTRAKRGPVWGGRGGCCAGLRTLARPVLS